MRRHVIVISNVTNVVATVVAVAATVVAVTVTVGAACIVIIIAKSRIWRNSTKACVAAHVGSGGTAFTRSAHFFHFTTGIYYCLFDIVA